MGLGIICFPVGIAPREGWGSALSFIYPNFHNSLAMLENSGKPAPSAQRTIDQYFDVIIAPRNPGRMLFYDEDDGRSEKDCMWEEY